MQVDQAGLRVDVLDTVEREWAVAIVVDGVHINLLLDQHLHKLLRIALHCIVKGVVSQVVLLETVHSTLPQNVANSHHVVKHCGV